MRTDTQQKHTDKEKNTTKTRLHNEKGWVPANVNQFWVEQGTYRVDTNEPSTQL